MNKKNFSLLLGVGIFCIPLLIPSPPGLSDVGWKVIGLSLLMAVFWIFESIPIYATSLLPLVICPIFNISTFQEVANPYANQIIFLFLGGFFLAIGLENTGLHKRFALKLLYLLGRTPNLILMSFIISTASISTIVNNTSTTMMMLPIALSVIQVINESSVFKISKDYESFSISILLSIAYSSSIGGVTTLIGTAPNIYMAGFINSTLGVNISFLDWLWIGLPFNFIGSLIIYFLFSRFLFKIESIDFFDKREFFKNEYKNLGKWKRDEIVILLIFCMAVLLWICQPFIIRYYKNINDGVIAIFSALLLFFIPINWKTNSYILDNQSYTKIPWDSILLFGGGFSLAFVIEKSKLAEWIGFNLGFFGGIPIQFQIIFVVSLIIFLTEFTSNIATTAVFLPILSGIAQANQINPLILILPATIAASCAFMFPVATPPNAIVFASGKIKISQMAKSGILVNLIYIIFISLLTYYIAIPKFGL